MDSGSIEINLIWNVPHQTSETLDLTLSNYGTTNLYNLRNMTARDTLRLPNTLNSDDQIGWLPQYDFSSYYALRERNNRQQPNLEDLSGRSRQRQFNREELSRRNGQQQSNLDELSGRNRQRQPNLEELLERNRQRQLNREELLRRNSQQQSNLEELLGRNRQRQPNLEELSRRNNQRQLNWEEFLWRSSQQQPNLDEQRGRNSQQRPNLEELSGRNCQRQPNLEFFSERNSLQQLNLEGLPRRNNQQQPHLQRHEMAFEQQQNHQYENIRRPRQFKLPTEEIPEAELDELMCSICLKSAREYKQNQRPVARTDCGHFFCVPCIFKWKKISRNCPFCRQPVLQLKGSRGLSMFHVI